MELLSAVRELVTYLPLSNKQKAPVYQSEDPDDRMCPMLDRIIPEQPEVRRGGGQGCGLGSQWLKIHLLMCIWSS